MEIRLGEQIRGLRKEAGLTQEQLAEALGVSVSAVHKWESGKANPELEMLVSIAAFFEVSVDVLLAYRWKSGGIEDTAERVRQLILEKHFEDAVAEAEKAMKKFPNNFEIVHQGAMAYLEWSHTFDMNGGAKDWQIKAHTRGRRCSATPWSCCHRFRRCADRFQRHRPGADALVPAAALCRRERRDAADPRTGRKADGEAERKFGKRPGRGHG